MSLRIIYTTFVDDYRRKQKLLKMFAIAYWASKRELS